MEAVALFDTLAFIVVEVEAERLGDKLGDVEAKALGDTVAEVESETLGETLGDVEAEALVDALAERLAEVLAETLGDKLGDVEALEYPGCEFCVPLRQKQRNKIYTCFFFFLIFLLRH